MVEPLPKPEFFNLIHLNNMYAKIPVNEALNWGKFGFEMPSTLVVGIFGSMQWFLTALKSFGFYAALLSSDWL